MEKGLLVVISAPAGCGKDSILDRLTGECDSIHYSVSATTRLPREGETEGVSYFFKTRGEFREMIERDELLEYAEYVGNYYGTPKAAVHDMLEAGKDVILKIEVEGAENVKRMFPECVLIFILPPSFEELERRLSGRGTEDSFTIASRIRRAKEELEKVPAYDYAVVNDVLEDAADDIKAIIRAEKLAVKRGIKPII